VTSALPSWTSSTKLKLPIKAPLRRMRERTYNSTQS
jgi:hypothetical protein